MKGNQIALVVVVIVVIIGVAVVTSGTVTLPSGSLFMPPVTIKDLYTNPDTYNGKVVTVKGDSRYGLFSINFELWALEDRGYALYFYTLPSGIIMDNYATYQATGKVVKTDVGFAMYCDTIEKVG